MMLRLRSRDRGDFSGLLLELGGFFLCSAISSTKGYNCVPSFVLFGLEKMKRGVKQKNKIKYSLSFRMKRKEPAIYEVLTLWQSALSFTPLPGTKEDLQKKLKTTGGANFISLFFYPTVALRDTAGRQTRQRGGRTGGTGVSWFDPCSKKNKKEGVNLDPALPRTPPKPSSSAERWRRDPTDEPHDSFPWENGQKYAKRARFLLPGLPTKHLFGAVFPPDGENKNLCKIKLRIAINVNRCCQEPEWIKNAYGAFPKGKKSL